MYGMDYIDGREVPQMVLDEDYVLTGEHHGTIHVEGGTLTISGNNYGTLDVRTGSKVLIKGLQSGTVSLKCGCEVIIYGKLSGTLTISADSIVTIEKNGILAGTLTNNGKLVVKGVFGGAKSGNGEIALEGNGYIKQPVKKNGMTYYEW